MANRERGEISFEASGKTWTMKIDTNAMCEIEGLTGKGIAEVGNLLGSEKTASMTLMRAVFFGSLRAQHPDLLIGRAGELMDEIGADKAGQLIGQAFQAAFPPAKAGSTRPPKATAAA